MRSVSEKHESQTGGHRRNVGAVPPPAPEPNKEIKEAVVEITTYLAIGLLRPSWITRRLHLSFFQHFRRLLVIRVLLLVAAPYFERFNDRAEAMRDDLRRELGREPTTEELAARFE